MTVRKIVEIPRFGGPEVFRVREAESEPLGERSVRIAVSAAGLNFADVMMRMGLYPEAPPVPFVPGYEVSGVVSEVGRGVHYFAVGDRVVAGCRFGGYATEIVVPENFVRKTPARLSDIEAASIPVNFLTAWIALQEMGRVRARDRVLIHSAAGGVGIAAVQIAAQAGATVTGLVGSPAKASAVSGLGAREIVTNEKWEAASDADAGGYDIILDAVGGESLKRSFRRLAVGGRVISFGVSSMTTGRKRSLVKAAKLLMTSPLYTPFKLMNENKGVYGLNMLKLFELAGERSDDITGRSLNRIMEGFEEGRFRAMVGKTFPLAEVGAAQEYLMSRANVGKVVLTN